MPFPLEKTWLIICDGAKAKFFNYKKNNLESLFDHELEIDHRPTHEVARDKPGRAMEADNISRHAFDPRMDWHERQKERMAEKIVAMLQDAEKAAKFDKLIVAAPPKFIGLLRKFFSKSLADKVKTEILKDLINVREEEIFKHLQKV